VAAVTLAMYPFRDELGVLNVLLLYLILSLLAGLLLGTRAAAVGAVLAFLAFDFFFIPPFHTFTIADQDHVLGLFVYLAVAIGAALLMSRLRVQTVTAVRESQRTTLLYDLNRSLVADVTLDSLMQTIAERVVQIYGSGGCRILVYRDGNLEVGAASPPGFHAPIDRQAQAMASYALDRRVPAGIGSRARRIRRRMGRCGSRSRWRYPIAMRCTSLSPLPPTTWALWR
jgi:two-component system sensor histidine kinase KdpD